MVAAYDKETFHLILNKLVAAQCFKLMLVKTKRETSFLTLEIENNLKSRTTY